MLLVLENSDPTLLNLYESGELPPSLAREFGTSSPRLQRTGGAQR